jgi:hypothetical protein
MVKESGLIGIIISVATIVVLVTSCANTVKNTDSSAIIQNKNNNNIDHTIQQTKTVILTVPEVYRNPDIHIEKKIRVRGRILARPHYSTGPCVPSEPCPPIINITLHLVSPDDPVNHYPITSLDLFEHTAEGTFKPMTCTFISKDNFDCRPYIQNAITTIEGIFIKHKIPYHTVGTSDGDIEVLKYSDIYIFVPGAENLQNTNPCGTGQTPVYERKGISRCIENR